MTARTSTIHVDPPLSASEPRPLLGRTIAVDVDLVCADLLPAWLDRYNADWNDTLTPKQITHWDVARFVKSECGTRIRRYLDDPSLYDAVEPIAGALVGVEVLRELGARVVFVTSAHRGHAGRKLDWLRDHAFLPADGKPTCDDYIEAHDKTMIRADLIIDDKPETCNAFSGLAILFRQPHNQGDSATPTERGVLVAPDWTYVPSMVRRMLAPASLLVRGDDGATAKTPAAKRETALEEAQRLVHGDRGDAYGHPFDDYTRTSRMWEAFLDLPAGSIGPRKAALMMALMKASREVHKSKRDNRVDLAGYAECADMIAEREVENAAFLASLGEKGRA